VNLVVLDSDVLWDQMTFGSSSTHLPFFLIEQALLDAAEDDSVGRFDSSVGLWVVHRSKDYLRAKTVTEFSEEL